MSLDDIRNKMASVADCTQICYPTVTWRSISRLCENAQSTMLETVIRRIVVVGRQLFEWSDGPARRVFRPLAKHLLFDLVQKNTSPGVPSGRV